MTQETHPAARRRPFTQVDVFTREPYRGNPLAVVVDADTGSFNAGAAQWLIGTGRAPASYLASLGTVLGRNGRVHIDAEGGDVWVGGSAVTCIRGSVDL